MKLGLGMLKGKNKYETIENLSIIFLVLGAVMLSLGIFLTVISPKGLSVILAMLGALISFISILVLVFTWLVKEFFSKPEESEQKSE